MNGLDLVLKIRKAGVTPDCVAIDVDGRYSPPRDIEDFLRPKLTFSMSENIRALDLRPIVGLQVLIFSDDWSLPVQNLFRAIQKDAGSVAIFGMGFGPDCLGMVWDADKGERPIHG